MGVFHKSQCIANNGQRMIYMCTCKGSEKGKRAEGNEGQTANYSSPGNGH